MAITFNGFNLQDSNFITSEIIFRGGPTREVVGQKTTRRPGIKYTTNEWAERVITLRGAILGDSGTDLQNKIDDLFKNVIRKNEGNLVVDTGRSIDAFVSNTVIEDAHYNQTYVPYEMEFTTIEPFFKENQLTVNLTTISGTTDHNFTITISGTAFAEPVITYSAPSGSGDTTISGIHITYAPTGERATWSGTGGLTALAYSDTVQFDWMNQFIVRNQANEEPSGVFARWEPGSTEFTVTFSGTSVGGDLTFAYQPRYF